jgi:hypothetical protein
MLRNAITVAAALALTAAPIAAQAAPQELSRASADVGESESVRGTTMWIVVALVAGGLLVIFWDDIFGDDEPDSP